MSHTRQWLNHGVLLLALVMVACAPRSSTPTQAPATVVPTPAMLPTPVPSLQPTVLSPALTPTLPAPPQRWEPAGQIEVAYPGRLIWAFGGQVLGVIAEDGLHLARAANFVQTRVITIASPSRLLDFSSDGHTMALTSDYSELSLQDANTGQVLRSLRPPQQLMSATFSPDGRELAVPMQDLTVSLWDIASGQMLKTLGGFETAAPVYNAVFATDGQHLIWISRAKVQIMDIATGKLGVEFRHEDFVMAVALSPDGKTLATAAAGTINGQYVPFVKLWDAASGAEIVTLAGEQSISSVQFSPDGRMLAAASGKDVILWDVARRSELATWEAHTDSIGAVAFSPDGSILASASADGTVKLWRAAP